MRILLAGHHELAAKVLYSLLESGFNVRYVAEDRVQSHRGPTLRSIGDQYGVEPILDQGEPALADAVGQLRPDILLSCGYHRIISSPVLKNVPYPINVHFGELPRYRGCWSVPWAILNGEAHIGVTLHRMDAGIDDGPIYSQRRIVDERTQSCRELYLEAVNEGVEMVLQWLSALQQGIIPAMSHQDEMSATYYGKEYPGGFAIDWRGTVLQVERYIRAAYFPPYLPAGSKLTTGERVFFHWPLGSDIRKHRLAPGTVVQLDNGIFGVAALNGFIIPRDVNLESGMPATFSEMASRGSWSELRFG